MGYVNSSDEKIPIVYIAYVKNIAIAIEIVVKNSFFIPYHRKYYITQLWNVNKIFVKKCVNSGKKVYIFFIQKCKTIDLYLKKWYNISIE